MRLPFAKVSATPSFLHKPGDECEDLRDDRLIQAHNVLESRQTMTDRCCDKALDLSYEIYFSEYSLISEDH